MKHSLVSEIPVPGRATGVLEALSELFLDREHKAKMLWRVAVHETGHLLAGAAFDRDIGTVEATVRSHWFRVSGGVVIEKVSLPTQSRPDLEAIRLCTLAGAAAERLVFGSDLGKHADDLARWRQAAVIYLTQYGYPGIAWNCSPVLAEALQANEESLWQLQQIDAGRTYQLLEGNQALLEDVARELVAARRLDPDRCHEILERVDRGALASH